MERSWAAAAARRSGWRLWRRDGDECDLHARFGFAHRHFLAVRLVAYTFDADAKWPLGVDVGEHEGGLPGDDAPVDGERDVGRRRGDRNAGEVFGVGWAVGLLVYFRGGIGGGPDADADADAGWCGLGAAYMLCDEDGDQYDQHHDDTDEDDGLHWAVVAGRRWRQAGLLVHGAAAKGIRWAECSGLLRGMARSAVSVGNATRGAVEEAVFLVEATR